MIARRTLLAILVFFLGAYCHPPAVAADEPRQYQLFFGLYQQPAADGILITGFTLASPSLAAGLKSGDIITMVNGVKVATWADVAAATRDVPPYTPVTFTVRRGSNELTCTVIPSGNLRWPQGPPRQPFAIPGAPAPAALPASPIEALDKVNILKQVVIDPATGRIDLIGDYDPRYATGALPYLDLLKTALQYPKPLLNLEPTPATWQEYGNWRWRAGMNLEVWQLLNGHPTLASERWQVLRKLAALYGVTPAEYARWHNWQLFDADGNYPPAAVASAQIKALRNAGYSDLANAYAQLGNTTLDATLSALKTLGLAAAAQARLAQGGDPARLGDDLTVMAYAALCRRIGIDTASAEASYRAGKLTARAFVREAQAKIWPLRDATGRPLDKLRSLDGLVLSSGALKALSNLSADCDVLINPIDLDPGSQLARIMYEADYSLKALSTRPDMVAERISGFVGLPEYIFQKFSAGYDNVTHTWLEPASAELKVAPDRHTVAFGPTKMTINCKYYPQAGQTLADAHQNPDFDAWAAMATGHYEELAQIFPALHKAREAAKIVALARWLKQEGIAVDLSGVQQERWSPPERIPGFWAVVLFARPSAAPAGAQSALTVSHMTGFEGGCSFYGQSWPRYTSAPETTNAVANQLATSAHLGQLAVRAAQNGDLQSARHLAELSAQAMTGAISPADYNRWQLAAVKPFEGYTAANVTLQKHLLKETWRQLNDSAAAPADLAKLQSAYEQVAANPIQASDFLFKLQTRQLDAGR